MFPQSNISMSNLQVVGSKSEYLNCDISHVTLEKLMRVAVARVSMEGCSSMASPTMSSSQ